MPPELYDDIGAHLAAAGSIERAAAPLGMYLAWCVNLRLLEPGFEREHERAALRLRYREITGSEWLVGACGGRFERRMLSEEGKRFSDVYYPRYLDEFREVFGVDAYAVTDDWSHYDRLAPVLTRRYMDRAGSRARGGADSAGPRRGWWRFWK